MQVDYETVKEQFKYLLTEGDDHFQSSPSSEAYSDESKDDDSIEENPFSTKTDKKTKNKSKTPVLDNFGRDLTAYAVKGKLDPIVGREKEIERVQSYFDDDDGEEDDDDGDDYDFIVAFHHKNHESSKNPHNLIQTSSKTHPKGISKPSDSNPEYIKPGSQSNRSQQYLGYTPTSIAKSTCWGHDAHLGLSLDKMVALT